MRLRHTRFRVTEGHVKDWAELGFKHTFSRLQMSGCQDLAARVTWLGCGTVVECGGANYLVMCYMLEMLLETKSECVPHMAVGLHQLPHDQVMRVASMVSSSGSDASVGSLVGRALSPVSTKFGSSLGIWGKLGVTKSVSEDKGGPWSWS